MTEFKEKAKSLISTWNRERNEPFSYPSLREMIEQALTEAYEKGVEDAASIFHWPHEKMLRDNILKLKPPRLGKIK